MKVNLRSIYLGNKNELLVMPLQTNLIFIGQCIDFYSTYLEFKKTK